MREAVFAALLIVAAGLIVAGVALVAVPVALVIAGLLLAGWAWLVLSGPDAEPAGGEAG
jgi:hypothetical protein